MANLEYRNLDTTDSYERLKSLEPPRLADVLDGERITEFDIEGAAGLRYNYAAKLVDEKILRAFADLAEEQQLVGKYRALVNGEFMNTGENRRVMHHSLRGDIADTDDAAVREIIATYHRERNRVYEFAAGVRSGALRGSTGKPFRAVVQIGIGGSDLGPRALYLALKNTVPPEDRLEAWFISNVDPDDPAEIISGLDLESTLFILVTKSGTTQETLTNRSFVLDAATRAGIPGFNASKHMVAVTSRTSPLADSDEFLDAFFIDDFVGGRYSSTSAVGGVVLSCAFGPDTFEALLDGAHRADKTAMKNDIAANPALMDALIGIYERSILGFPSTAILPYSQALNRFPAHLQQLDMESNGKRVNRNAEPVGYATGPIVFGEPGTNGQHSFYQLLHQGTDIVPLQFIGFESSQLGIDAVVDGRTSQQKLNANLAAQIVAFALGKHDVDGNRFFPGNRPSSLLYGKALLPGDAGALLSHFENKVMFQGFAWNLNSFDQEGVQLGKVLAQAVLQASADEAPGTRTSADMQVLMTYARLLGNDI